MNYREAVNKIKDSLRVFESANDEVPESTAKGMLELLDNTLGAVEVSKSYAYKNPQTGEINMGEWYSVPNPSWAPGDPEYKKWESKRAKKCSNVEYNDILMFEEINKTHSRAARRLKFRSLRYNQSITMTPADFNKATLRSMVGVYLVGRFTFHQTGGIMGIRHLGDEF